MMCLLTERWLRPGAFTDFRGAWEPAVQPEGLVRAGRLRDRDDQDHVISFGGRARAWGPTPDLRTSGRRDAGSDPG